MNAIAHRKLKLSVLLVLGLLLVLVARNWNDLQILYAKQKFRKLINTEYVSANYSMQVTERYLIPSQARGTIYGIEDQTSKEKYVLFYFQRQNGKSAIYEVYADDGISRSEVIEILKSNHKNYEILYLDIFGFYLGTRDQDIHDFLYWRASPIDTPQESVFIKFTTGELLHSEEAIYH